MTPSIPASSCVSTSDAPTLVCVSVLFITRRVITDTFGCFMERTLMSGKFPLTALEMAWSEHLKPYFCLERERVAFFFPDFFSWRGGFFLTDFFSGRALWPLETASDFFFFLTAATLSNNFAGKA